MSCHFTCTSSCFGSEFTSCLVCDGSASLINSACFCSLDWNTTCTYNLNLQSIYTVLQSFFTVMFPLLMLLFCLKVKLPFSYRLLVGLQGLSLLVFSKNIYLYFENQFGLTFLSKANGFFNFSNRLQGASIDHAIGQFVLLGCFFVAFLTLYPLTQTFCKPYSDYQEYLTENFKHFANSFFFFASKMMFYFIGLWANSMSTTISILVPFCLFALIALGILIKFFYDFHKNNITEEEVYQPQLYLYSMLSSIPMLGLPLVSSSTMYMIIYLSPLGLLLLIMLLNKGYEICSKGKVIFYVIEIVMAGLTVGFVVLSDPIRSYLLLGTINLCLIVMIIELSVLYYSGLELKRSSKVHPESQSSLQRNQLQKSQEPEQKKDEKIPKKSMSKSPYF